MSSMPWDRLQAAASTALAPTLGPVEVHLGERLPSSERAMVVRAVARDTVGADHAVVLKAPTGSGEGSLREEAALTLAAKQGLAGVVRLLGVSADPPLLVLADLGGGPTLADRLLGSDPAAADTAVLAWAGAVGGMQAATARSRPAFAAGLEALSALGVPAVDTTAGAVAEAAAVLARDLPRLGVIPSVAALAELRGLAGDLDVSGPGAAGALVPGDTCPSNAVETDDGLVLLDFEGAEYRHLAWEAAYLTVPWPSCWCSWRLPDGLITRALQRWQQTLAPAAPVVTSAGFRDDLARASIGWVFISAGWFLAAALDGDPPPLDPARRAVIPTRRALLQHRLALAAEYDTTVLPALRKLASQSQQAAVGLWGPHPLPLATAFR